MTFSLGERAQNVGGKEILSIPSHGVAFFHFRFREIISCLFEDNLKGFRGCGKPEGAGDRRGGSEASFAIEAKVAARFWLIVNGPVLPRVSGVLCAEDRAKAKRCLGLFLGKRVVLPETLSNQLEEPVVRGIGKVVGLDSGWISFTSGSSHHHERQISVATGGDEIRLLLDLVDGVDNAVVAGLEEFLGGSLVKERVLFVDHQFRVDEAEPLGDCFHFEAADVSIERRKLAVHIRNADLVQIDQGEFSDSTPCECFRGPRPHATNPDHRDVCGADPF